MAKKDENLEQMDAIKTMEQQVKFNKNKILAMKRYADRTDLLQVLLNPEESYTLAQVDAAISDFMNSKVMKK